MTLIIFLGAVKLPAEILLKSTQKLNLPEEITSPVLTKEEAKKIQPKDISEKTDKYAVVNKIVDNIASFWWENSALKRSQFGKAVETVEKKAKIEAEFKDSNKMNHKIAFKIMAMQALAKLEYSGWIRAALNYDARASRANAEVTQTLGESFGQKQDLVLSHSIAQSERISQISLRWNW